MGTEVKLFNSPEFGKLRGLEIDGEPWFVGRDVAQALGYGEGKSLANAVANHVDELDRSVTEMMTEAGKRNMVIINESGLYALIFGSKLESAKRFKRWVTAEVLPAIRKTGSYQQRPLSIPQQIQMIAQGYSDLGQQVTEVQAEVTDLKDNMPLYACETEEVSNHVKRKIVDILGGKQSGAYADRNLRSAVFSDIYSQIKREYGLVSSYKSIKRKYLGDVHDFIDTYDLPTALAEQVAAAGVME